MSRKDYIQDLIDDPIKVTPGGGVEWATEQDYVDGASEKAVDPAGLKNVLTNFDLNRPEVESDFTAVKPTKDELITAIEKLPDYVDNSAFWEGSHDFYVFKDANRDKMCLVKYRGKTGATSSDTGTFFYEMMREAVNEA